MARQWDILEVIITTNAFVVMMTSKISHCLAINISSNSNNN